MANSAFENLPPFPDDDEENVPTAPLLKISLEKLIRRDREECTRFIKACEDLGFFYLDLLPTSGSSSSSNLKDYLSSSDSETTTLGQNILLDADKLFGVGEKLFDLDVEEKQKYDFVKLNSYFGYKGLGANVVDRDGTLDRNEFYNVSKDDILGISDRWPAPDVLDSQRDLFRSFMTSAHAIVTIVLDLLNEHLKLPSGTLAGMHRLQGNSGDQVRFVKAPPQPMNDRKLALGEHTDFGSVTVLFNRLGGLQVLPPGKDAKWCYVKPLANHAIVNLGDAMVKFTNGLLRSNIHRVISPPGAQADCTRYSLVYFARPEDHVMMKRLNGSSDMIPPLADGVEEVDITSKDWIIGRALNYRHAVHGKSGIDWHRFRGTEAQSRRDNN